MAKQKKTEAQVDRLALRGKAALRRPVLGNVHVEDLGDHRVAVASSGYILAIVETNEEPGDWTAESWALHRMYPSAPLEAGYGTFPDWRTPLRVAIAEAPTWRVVLDAKALLEVAKAIGAEDSMVCLLYYPAKRTLLVAPECGGAGIALMAVRTPRSVDGSALDDRWQSLIDAALSARASDGQRNE